MSKLRENNKTVIGVGVKNSSSDLLIHSCDEFIFYDDLVGRSKPAARTKTAVTRKKKASAGTRAPTAAQKKKRALDLVVETFEALLGERGDEEKIWGSMIKQALKRRKPGFNESSYGFGSFGALLEEAGEAGILDLERDRKSGGFIVRKVLKKSTR